ncbi:MAG TPA: UDP-N-acetylglucosamine 2-epimerase (non-hydrolyzing) [Candidatus Omnitrophota bacterium]|nr:UDP-N-acetylglucosamine 2-epimerase (non-hydrolyzing) [Candidatus Omnitrophota bacterium]HPS19550.1 UDP-N-acetylglucosamine 2-epimerase (non-hydrolyzing) [Candidatus Omnitrophota bacterium]
MKIAFVFGTRPEIIKLSPVIRLAIKAKVPFITIHTGQHYSDNMSKFFINELDLPRPDYNLNVRSKAPYMQGDHTGRMMIKLEEILLKEMPTDTLVQGDTNSTLAGALVTSKISTTKSFTGFEIKLGHIEAGLRSYDRNMPEEINRVITDHLSDYLFVPTGESRDIALSEGVDKKKVYITGNTIVDALYESVERSKAYSDIIGRNKLSRGGYMLLTLHRQENVDNKKRVVNMIAGIKKIKAKYGLPVVFPIHPRTVKKMEMFGIDPLSFATVIEPTGFLDFLALEDNAALVITDSGGLQEESCVLKVPCITLRDTTERPETVTVGANMLAGACPDKILECAKKMISKKRNWKNPFGNGDTAKRIMKILKERA